MRYFLPVILAVVVASQPIPPHTIWLYGDSISRGYGLSEFEHPSPINSIQGIANLLLIENGHPEITVKWSGSQDAQRLWLDRHENYVFSQDVIIFENAGPHFGPEPYRAWLKLWEYGAGDNRLYLTTTPDNRPVGDINDFSEINPVVRAEAGHLLDWEAEFAAKAGVVDLLLPDGVHPNAFGNFVMAVSILRSQGVEVESYESVIAAFDGYYESVDVPAVLGQLVE